MLIPPSLGRRCLTSMKRLKNFSTSKFLPIGLRVLLAAGIAFFLSQSKLDFAEYYLYDLRARLSPEPSLSGNTSLVYIDTDTVQNMRGLPTAKDLHLFLDKISAQNPRFIIFTINPNEIQGSLEEKRAFAIRAASTPGFYFTSDELALKGEEESLTLAEPFAKAPVFSAPKTADTKIFAKDGVTRRMLYSYQDQSLLHHFIAASYNGKVSNPKSIKGSFEFAGSQQVFVNFHNAGAFPRDSFTNVTSGASQLPITDKIIILGTDLGKTSQEYIMTPLSRDIKAMTVAEMHANMFETLIQNNSIVKTPNWLNTLFIFLISILTIHVVLALTPARGLLILVSTFLGFSALSWAAYWANGLWIQMAAPLLAIFLCYYFFIPYRLIIENRRSWEYQQKNKLLSQVEELKTNFISMMSHDLKTPLARIHGMTEVILKDSVTLSSPQIEAVDTIKSSADDLLKFINAILAYARIESESVQLHLLPKDINRLIEDVIQKHDFLTKLKMIQIVTELEPMFPIQVDPNLMTQVLSNLIENAIKYSPEETKILVTTEEVDNKIHIQVSDQGPGINSQDLPNVFMKFYRCKNAKTSPIKGSGLGLYLAKYFIELHSGSISAESTLGQGSTFTIEIPNDLGGKNA